MKKLIWLFLGVLIVSCSNEVKDYATLSGTIKTPNTEKITVQGRGYSKEITVDKNGKFSDTLKITDGVHAIANGNDRITLFLKNGYDLNLEFKGEKFSEGIAFTGNGAETNNFMEKKRSFYLSDLANPKTYFTLDKEAYEAKVVEAKNILKGYKEDVKNIDSLIGKMDTRNDDMFFGYIEKNYEKMHENIVRFARGKVSPKFKNYENIDGSKTSLIDLRGKYVFIDVWATWCAPCKAEIPHLKALEKEYHDKNIEFVSISVDQEKDHQVWKDMIKSDNLTGIQLFADKGFDSEFMREYDMVSIPRFLLLDPEGNIIDSDAARPSDPKLKELFTELGI